MDPAIALQVVQAGVTAVLGYLVFDARKYAEAYASAKGTNLATKEDIAGITREIESVKAELSLNVEVRKVVATKKVEALAQVAKLSSPLIGTVFAPKDDIGKRIAALDEYWSAVREAEPFVDRAALQAATAYGFELQEGLSKAQDISQVPEIYRRAEGARRRLIEKMREELQLEPLREGDLEPVALLRVKGAETHRADKGSEVAMTTTKRGRGRPPTGCPVWDPDTQQWIARILTPSGSRKPVPMPGITEHEVERAHAKARKVAEGGEVRAETSPPM